MAARRVDHAGHHHDRGPRHGYLDHSNLLLDRLLDTLVGVTIGLLVTLLVWPPMRDRAAAAFVTDIAHEIGEVLTDIADRLNPDLDAGTAEEWLKMCRAVDFCHDEAWGLIRKARESTRSNPRKRARTVPVLDLEDVVHGLEQAVAEVQSMIRTVAISAGSANTWQDGLRAAGPTCSPRRRGRSRTTTPTGSTRCTARCATSRSSFRPTTCVPATGRSTAGFLVNLHNVVTCMLPVARWHQARTAAALHAAVGGTPRVEP